MLPKEYHISQCSRITELIECYIIENGMKSRDKLPSEREFCEMWDCNRMTLRAAINSLERAGELLSVHGSGNYVAEERFEMSLMDIEAFLAELQEKGHLPKTKLISVNKILSDEKLAEALGVEVESPAYEIKRLRYIDEIPVILDTSYISCQACNNIEEYINENGSVYDLYRNKYGIEISNGDVEIDVTEVERQDAEKLNILEKQTIFTLNILTRDKNNRAIEVINALARPDKIKFASRLK